MCTTSITFNYLGINSHEISHGIIFSELFCLLFKNWIVVVDLLENGSFLRLRSLSWVSDQIFDHGDDESSVLDWFPVILESLLADLTCLGPDAWMVDLSIHS